MSKQKYPTTSVSTAENPTLALTEKKVKKPVKK
jgi:hypothetical protein